jgi:hypothetical protein
MPAGEGVGEPDAEELAVRTGLSVRAIGDLERGRTARRPNWWSGRLSRGPRSAPGVGEAAQAWAQASAIFEALGDDVRVHQVRERLAGFR